MKFKFNKHSISISAQLLIMLSLLNLGIPVFSFVLGYFIFIWATQNNFFDINSLCQNDDSFCSVDYIWIFLIFLSGFIWSTFLALKFAKRYTQPIMSLATVLKEIQQGNLSSRIDQQNTRTPYEIVCLIENFNAMANQLEISAKNSSIWNAAIAHELRTPITILQGRLQGVVDGIFEADHQLHCSLLSKVERLSYLIEDLRTLTLFENKKFCLNLEETTLKDNIYKCIGIFQDRFQDKGLHIISDLTNDKTICDTKRIEQVLIALFTNALRYANPGTLSITTKTAGNYWFLIIEDQGPGIDEEYLEHLFKPFYRFKVSSLDGGTGLGLAIIYAIVDAHDGEITYTKSKNLGGSCFTIRLKEF